MTETTVGREPVQIVEIKQPYCAHKFGVFGPDDIATATHTAAQGDTVTSTDVLRTASHVADFTVTFAASPVGVIWEQGATTAGLFLGVTAGGELVFRAGSGVTGDSPETAMIRTPVAPFVSKTLRIIVEIIVGTASVRMSLFENGVRIFFAEDTAADGVFPSGVWAGSNDGGVGKAVSTVAGNESTANWNSTISSASFYDSLEITYEFGCRASAATGSECFHTLATCQDEPNFSQTELSLFFSSGKVAERRVTGAPYIIPSLTGVSTSPTRINLAGSNPDAEGLGNRALCSLGFTDHPHTDRRVDPYVETRTYDPLTRGSFWTKWLARNKYRQNIQLVVYEGYAGQILADMKRRTYFFDSIQGPDDAGRIQIQGKDILARLEERKAQAPRASPGVLYTDITDSATSFEVARAFEDDYPASGTLRIDREVMTYTSRANSTNGVTFSGVTRGTDGTEAATHRLDALVQECLRVVDQRIDDVLELLLVTYGEIPIEYLDLSGWQTEIDEYMSFWRLNTLLTEPFAVTKLVSEIQEQTLVNCWWDERLTKVKLRAVRGVDALPPLYTAEANIVAGSFRLTERPKERVSQIWIYYDQINYALSSTEASNYSKASIIANLVEEARYNEPSIRKIFARWLNSAALADTTASKIITRYVAVPSQAQFRMDAKDRNIWTGDTIRISHPLDVDAFGNRRIRQWTIISAEEVQPGETVEYVAEDTTLYGRIFYVMAGGSADYPGYDVAPFKNCYVGNADGLLSDGQPCGRIS